MRSDESKPKERTAYEILGVPANAGPDEVQNAYRIALTKWSHSEKTPEDDRAYDEIKKAYETVNTPEKRLNYDVLLRDKNKPPEVEVKFETFEERVAKQKAAMHAEMLKRHKEMKEIDDRITADKLKRQEKEEKEQKIAEPRAEEPKAVQTVEVKASDSSASVEKKEIESLHAVTRSGETFTYDAKLQENKLVLQNTHCPSASKPLSEHIIAYLQDQIMQAQRVFGKREIIIDLPENMDKDLKDAYVMVCYANNVECTVNGVKQENINKEDLQVVREKVLNDMEKRLEDLHRNVKEQKVPKDFSSQIAEIKQAAQIVKTESGVAQDFKRELKAGSLISMANRLDTMAHAVEKKAEQEKVKVATVTQESEVTSTHSSRMTR